MSFCNLNYRLPFDWQTPFGYIFAFLSQLIATFFVCLSGATVLITSITVCWMLVVFIKDITNDLHVLNICEASNGMQLSMKKQFGDIIQLYGDVRQLSRFYLFSNLFIFL